MSNDKPTYEELLIENENLKKRLSALDNNSFKSALTESEEKYRALVNNVKSIIYTLKSDGTVTFVSPSWKPLLGHEPDEIIGTNFAPLIYPEDLPYCIDFLQKTADTGTIQPDQEYRIFRKDGSLRWHCSVVTPVFDNQNQFLYFIGNATDISERKRVEQALNKSEEKYRTLVQYSGDPIFCFNPDETYRFVNEAFAKIVGKLPEDIIGKTPHSIFGSEEAENRLRLIRQVFKSGQKGEIEVEVILPSRIKAYFITIADPVIDQQGNILWVSCISKNITARKEAELLIMQQNNELHKLNADKDRFMTILAHDLRGPFSSILGLLDLLATNIHNYDIGKIEKQINTLNNSAKATYQLLEDVLLWIRANSGKIPYEPRKLVFANIYSDIAVNYKLAANTKGITINYLASEEVILFADGNMVSTILRNLVSNAIKFTHTGGRIDIGAVKNQKMATIAISDNGIGISAEVISRLFDISKLYSTKGTGNERGTGFGLLICKEFVENHGGRIWVESEVGKGSDFKFTLPLYDLHS
ncbi:MAG: PAS domain-containing sensor histidine kinase [Mariniphaga sp.]